MQSSVSTSRGHDFKLYKKVIKYDLRQYFFSERIVDLWNCLSTCVVRSPSVDSFREILTSFGVTKTFIITTKQP